MDYVTCPICDLADASVRDSNNDAYMVSCPRCGHYSISRSAAIERGNLIAVPNPTAQDNQAANASGWIREHPHVQLNTYDIRHLRALRAPTIAERAEKILAELVRRSPTLGSTQDINLSNLREAAEWMG